MAETQVFLLAPPSRRAQCCSLGSSLLPLQALQAPPLRAVPDVLPHTAHSSLPPQRGIVQTLSIFHLDQSDTSFLTLARTVYHLHFLSCCPDNFPRPRLCNFHVSLCITKHGSPEKPLCSSPCTFNSSFLAENRWCGKR